MKPIDLVLTQAEYQRGRRQGKFFRRLEALGDGVHTSANYPPRVAGPEP